MAKFLDRTGQRFGRLLVIGPMERRKNAAYWTCRCDCGKEKVIFGGSLQRGLTKSCGCLSSETTAARNRTHSLTGTPEYRVWASIRTRCTNPAEVCYPNYGGRGITLAERWNSFENFLADMGERPTPSHQVDRIDNDGPYSPENCRWATPSENCNNRRNNRIIEHGGRILTLAEWSHATGLKSHTIKNRIDRLGWTVERALTTPPRFDPRYHQR